MSPKTFFADAGSFASSAFAKSDASTSSCTEVEK